MIPDLPLMQEILSNNPVEFFIIPAIRVQIAGAEPICLCHAYRDYVFELDGQQVEFMGGQFTLEEPKRNTNTAQSLKFGFAGASARASSMVRQSLETGEPVSLEIFKFIEHRTGTTKLGDRYRPMELLASTIEGDVATFEGRFAGILDLAFPREVFNSDNAPGTIYSS